MESCRDARMSKRIGAKRIQAKGSNSGRASWRSRSENNYIGEANGQRIAQGGRNPQVNSSRSTYLSRSTTLSFPACLRSPVPISCQPSELQNCLNPSLLASRPIGLDDEYGSWLAGPHFLPGCRKRNWRSCVSSCNSRKMSRRWNHSTGSDPGSVRRHFVGSRFSRVDWSDTTHDDDIESAYLTSEKRERIQLWVDSAAQEALSLAQQATDSDLPVSKPEDLYLAHIDWERQESWELPETAGALQAEIDGDQYTRYGNVKQDLKVWPKPPSSVGGLTECSAEPQVLPGGSKHGLDDAACQDDRVQRRRSK